MLATLVAALLLTAPPAFATDVSGIIGTQTWTKAGSPYVVTDDVIVGASDTLVVEAGVEVLADSGARVVVHGHIAGLGTELDSVGFTNSAPTLAWGGIRVLGGSAEFRHTSISGAVADSGGGIYVAGGSASLDLSHCVVSHNAAFASTREFPFSPPTLHGFGGGIAATAGATVSVIECRLESNSTNGTGGGIAVSNATVRVESSKLSQNSAYGTSWDGNGRPVNTGIGGAVGTVNGSLVSMENTEISANHAGVSGGGVVVIGGTCTVSGSSLSDNWCDGIRYGNLVSRYAQGHGGGVFATESASLVLADCTIERNVVNDVGGGVYLIGGAHATVDSCLFSANRTIFTGDPGAYGGGQQSGGGLAVMRDGSATVSDCRFTAHTVAVSGSGILVSRGAISVQNTSLTGNASYSVVDIYNSPLELTDVVIDSNDAMGVHIHWKTETLEVERCRITRNKGTGLFMGAAAGVLRNCTIADNGGPGVAADANSGRESPAVLAIENSIVWNNGGSSTLVDTRYGPSLSPRFEIWYSVAGEDTGSVLRDGVIVADPLFADATNGDYRLSELSPAVDSGAPYLPADIDGSLPDMGFTGGGGARPDVPWLDVAPGQKITPVGSSGLAVRNRGTATLLVKDVALPDSFSATEPLPFEIGPGETRYVAVVYSCSPCEISVVPCTLATTDPFRPSAEVSFMAAPGTIVRGDVGSQRWTREKGPYLVRGTIFVGPGDTLTIDHGTSIIVESVTQCSIVVEGHLSALGTGSSPVSLSSTAGALNRVLVRADGSVRLRETSTDMLFNLRNGGALAATRCELGNEIVLANTSRASLDSCISYGERRSLRASHEAQLSARSTLFR